MPAAFRRPAHSRRPSPLRCNEQISTFKSPTAPISQRRHKLMGTLTESIPVYSAGVGFSGEASLEGNNPLIDRRGCDGLSILNSH